jgi:uncharacterized protein (TIGR00297 family)
MTQLTHAPLSNFDIGAVASAAVAFAAYRTRSLTASGALAAVIVGTATFGALGLGGAAVLLTFFVTGVALSRIRTSRKSAAAIDVEKGGARDAGQVFANGAIAAACAVLALTVDPRFAIAFAGAFAAAAADTWATEIGTLANVPPRSILTLRPIAAGLSGGVTALGTLAGIAGAIAIALVARGIAPHAFLAVTCAGIAGSLADSVLGASVQALRFCPNCKRHTEREPHTCGANTSLVRGFGWLGNDTVNFAATLAGAAVAFALAR